MKFFFTAVYLFAIGMGSATQAQDLSNVSAKAVGLQLQIARDFSRTVSETGDSAAKNQINQLATKGYIEASGKKFYLSLGLLKFLQSLLVQGKSFEILSMARSGFGVKHGDNSQNLVSAIDISAFQALTVRSDNPNDTMNAVFELMDAVIQPIPFTEIAINPATYTFGLPRTAYKVGQAPNRKCGPLGVIDGNACDRSKYPMQSADLFNHPENYDMFLPAIYNESFVPSGALHDGSDGYRDLDLINNYAAQSVMQDKIKTGMSRGIRYTAFMPDALDHIHVTVDSDAVKAPL